MGNYMTQDNEPNPSKTKWHIGIALCLVAIVASVFFLLRESHALPRGDAVRKIADMQATGEQKQLAEVILTNYTEYRANTVRWSGIYFTCLFLSAAFSAFAGFVLKVKLFAKLGVAKEDLAALLATLAALLVTLSTAGDFHRKWQSNRIAAAETEALAYDLLKTPLLDVDRENIVSSLKEIGLNRNHGIVGDKTPPSLAKAGVKASLK